MLHCVQHDRINLFDNKKNDCHAERSEASCKSPLGNSIQSYQTILKPFCGSIELYVIVFKNL